MVSEQGEALWEAKLKCPKMVILPAYYPLYVHFSKQMRRILEEYSDRVEAFGLDENWLDLTNPGITLDDGERVAQQIRQCIKEELGITVSVGVADNKIMAKLGSDMKNPDAVTLIRPDEMENTVWRLPASDLLYVGPATRKKLQRVTILTIGDFARADDHLIKSLLGKNGQLLQTYARGEDRSPVMPVGMEMAIKSVGNSTTTPRDMETLADVKCVLYLLSESVAKRLREHGFHSRCITIHVRTTELARFSHQVTLDRSVNVTSDIARNAYNMFRTRFKDKLPLRSIGVSCGQLTPDDAAVQLDLFDDAERRLRVEAFERAIDTLRDRYGHQVIQRGITLFDSRFAEIKPKEDHTIHPVPFFSG